MPDMDLANSAVHYVNSITLDRMPQQAKIKTQADDWTGLSNQAERRRRQNRLNQRAYRKRREAEGKGPPRSTHSFRAFSTSSDEESNPTLVLQDQVDTGPWQAFSSAIASTKPQISTLARLAIFLHSEYDRSSRTTSQFQKWIAKNRLTGSPKADHVLTLVKFNIFRAMVKNSAILGFSLDTSLREHALSPFTGRSAYSDHLNTFLRLPTALRPTLLQCQAPHHPWIDFLPVPKMRDNVILAQDFFNEHDLCEDLCGLFNQKADTGLIAWGEPWDPSGFEITPNFSRKWGWSLKGCAELMVATNYWRAKRSEKPLNFDGLDERVWEIC